MPAPVRPAGLLTMAPGLKIYVFLATARLRVCLHSSIVRLLTGSNARAVVAVTKTLRRFSTVGLLRWVDKSASQNHYSTDD
jgi:hypothetical protein